MNRRRYTRERRAAVIIGRAVLPLIWMRLTVGYAERAHAGMQLVAAVFITAWLALAWLALEILCKHEHYEQKNSR